jgi:uncharacterized membrane protein
MAKTATPIGDAISYGWSTMKKNFLLFFYIALTFLLVQVITHIPRDDFITLILVVVGIVASMILKLGVVRITLDIHDKKRTNYKQLFSQPNLFPDYLVGTILYALIVIGGLILLIVPGIIWGIKYSLYEYYIVDKKMTPFEALKRSGKATYGHKWMLFKLYLVFIGINILGALCLLVGLFATVPTTWNAMASVYKALDRRK